MTMLLLQTGQKILFHIVDDITTNSDVSTEIIQLEDIIHILSVSQ